MIELNRIHRVPVNESQKMQGAIFRGVSTRTRTVHRLLHTFLTYPPLSALSLKCHAVRSKSIYIFFQNIHFVGRIFHECV